MNVHAFDSALMPIAAKHIADAIPEQLAYKVGADAFGTLDGQVFFPSKLERQARAAQKYFYSHLQKTKLNIQK